MRPKRITALSLFFAAGAIISFTTACALLFPDSFLKWMWALNPRAHDGFQKLGVWAIVLMLAVSGLCLLASVGLWRLRRWGYNLGIALLCANLIGDTFNVLLGTEPRAIIGIPIATIILIFITRPHIRAFFQ